MYEYESVSVKITFRTPKAMNNGQVSDFQRGEGNSTIAMRLTQGEITCMTDWERNDVHHNNQLLARGFLGASGWGALALIPPGVSLNEPKIHVRLAALIRSSVFIENRNPLPDVQHTAA